MDSILGEKKIHGNVSVNEFVNTIIEEATREGASDIHIEPMVDNVRVKFRIDGVLHQRHMLPRDTHDYIINRLRVVCNLEFGHARVPEDGHFTTIVINSETGKDRELDIRVSIFPTINGEAAVLRVLNRAEMLLSLQDIGFDAEMLKKIRELAVCSSGMVLATGPTGSGKTTTLYSILMQIDRKERNIITLEDPIEFRFDDMRQSQIHPDVGFTFAVGMRSILRQDPDVVMIGEIRDEETAEYAVKASLSGRAVYSTLHAKTTVGAIARLIDMGIERGLLAYSVNGVISQRLIRKVCNACVTEDHPREIYLEYLGLNGADIAYKRGAGCNECDGTGYHGRIGIFEVLIFDDNLRALIIDKASMIKIQEYIVSMGTKTLRDRAIEKVVEGITTVEEAIKYV